jgi:hypothetical protein
LAFDDKLGLGNPQPTAQDYTVSATGLVSRTLGLWSRRLIQYIIIVGIIGVVCTMSSLLLLFTLFGTIGVLQTDPFTYFFNIFIQPSLPDLTLVVVSLLFAIVAFVINAIIGGAAIKFALDDYNTHSGDIRTSFSHSFGKILNFVAVQLVISFLVSILLIPGLILLNNSLGAIDIIDPFNPIFPPGALEMMMMGFIFILAGALIMIYISARLSPTLAIVMDTDLSAIGSLKKSWEITSGNVWHVIAGRILFGIVVIVLGLAVSAFVYPLSFYNIIPETFSSVVENIVIALLFSVLNFIFPVVLYRDLSSRAKGSSLDELML